MPILLKIRWDITAGRERDFRENQQKLCTAMRDDHPGVICYHVDYPKPDVSEWTEIYANDATFRAHLENEKGRAPLAVVIAACRKITCQCWGDPEEKSREILAGFGATYQDTAEGSYIVNPRADRSSRV